MLHKAWWLHHYWIIQSIQNYSLQSNFSKEPEACSYFVYFQEFWSCGCFSVDVFRNHPLPAVGTTLFKLIVELLLSNSSVHFPFKFLFSLSMSFEGTSWMTFGKLGWNDSQHHCCFFLKVMFKLREAISNLDLKVFLIKFKILQSACHVALCLTYYE